MKKLFQYSLVAVCAMAFAGSSALAADPVNDKCPVSGKDVDASKTVDYTQKFCCEKCVAKFEKDPTAYAEKVAAADEGKCPISGKDVAADQSATVTIGACCSKCVKKISAEPAKFFGELQKAS